MQNADQELINQFKAFRDYTIELTKRVPKELLNEVPSNQSFLGINNREIKIKTLLAHTGYSVDWWMSNVIKDGKKDIDDWEFVQSDQCDNEYLRKKMEANKNRIIEYFTRDDGSNFEKQIDWEDDGKRHSYTGRQHLFYMFTHELNHYGRLMIALREFGFNSFPWQGC